MKTEWVLNFFSEENIEMERERTEKRIGKFVRKWKDKNFTKDEEILKRALDDYERLKEEGIADDEGYYYSLNQSKNLNDTELKAKIAKHDDFVNDMHDKIRFFVLRISKIDKEKQKEFLKSGLLKDYRHFLERKFREGRHLLSDEEERIIALKDKSSREYWVDMVSGFLAKEEREVFDGKEKRMMNFSEIYGKISDKNKEIRDSAVNAFNDIIKKNEDAAEAEINAILEDKKNNDKIRKYKKPDSGRIVGDDISRKFVESLIERVRKSFEISRRYYKLKAGLFEKEKLDYNERNVSFGNTNKKYSYEDAFALVEKVFENIDSDFADVLRKFSNEGRIDVFPGKDKRQGAFCIHNLKKNPVYVLLNFNEELRDVTTIAHEFGHAINAEFMKKQKQVDYDVSLATAEVASVFMEDFVFQELLKEADEEEELVLRMEKLNDEVSTIMRQIACYLFERDLHEAFREKGYLSKEEIGELFKKNMESYMGDFIDSPEWSKRWWIHWHHIRYYFYVYSYSSGLLIAKAMQNFYKKDKGFIKEVKKFLSTGLSKSPEEIFEEMGINIDEDFWGAGLEEVDNFLNETEELAKKLGRIE